MDPYLEYKPLLFSIAYHIVGNRDEAEDMVQEAFLALEKQNPNSVRNRKAYLCRTVHNMSVNKLKSAARQRELYTGIWLPEPVVTDEHESQSPEASYVMKESLSMACNMLIRQLTATERTVFVLRTVFQLPFEEIGDIVGKSANTCRQVFYRARKSLVVAPNQTPAALPLQAVPAGMTAIVERFVQALSTGNIGQLVDVLSEKSTLYMDGGPNEKTALKPIIGAKLITRLFEAVEPQVPKPFRCEIREINGRPGIIMTAGGFVFAVFSFNFNGAMLSNIYLMRNPDKLRQFNA